MTQNPFIRIFRLKTQFFINRFDELMDSLLKLLVGMRVGPLSQLLLRLDFNYWFSLKVKPNQLFQKDKE